MHISFAINSLYVKVFVIFIYSKHSSFPTVGTFLLSPVLFLPVYHLKKLSMCVPVITVWLISASSGKPVSSPIKLLFPPHAFRSFQDVNKHLFSSCCCRCVLIFSKLSITELFSKNAAFSSQLQSNHIKTCSLAEVIISLIADVCNTLAETWQRWRETYLSCVCVNKHIHDSKLDCVCACVCSSTLHYIFYVWKVLFK